MVGRGLCGPKRTRCVMQITQHEITAFFLGAAFGSAITYWYVTIELRIISGVRRTIDTLVSFHELSREQSRKARNPTQLASSEEILKVYQWAEAGCERIKKEYHVKISPILLTAEAIICEQLLELDRTDAWPVLLKCKRERRHFSEIGALLAERTAASADQKSNPS